MASTFAVFTEPTFGNNVLLGKVTPPKPIPTADSDPVVKGYADGHAQKGIDEFYNIDVADFSAAIFDNAWEGQTAVSAVPFAWKLEGNSVILEISGIYADALVSSYNIFGVINVPNNSSIIPSSQVYGATLASDNGVQTPCSIYFNDLGYFRIQGINPNHFTAGHTIGFNTICFTYPANV